MSEKVEIKRGSLVGVTLSGQYFQARLIYHPDEDEPYFVLKKQDSPDGSKDPIVYVRDFEMIECIEGPLEEQGHE